MSIQNKIPGLLLTVGLATMAYLAAMLPPLSKFHPMIIGLLLSIALRNIVGLHSTTKPGIAFSQRRVLRVAVALLGIQLSFSQIAEVGVVGLAIILGALIGTFSLTTCLGRFLGVDPRLSELIASGTSICGASAIVATNTITQGRDEDVAYAVASITLFGSLSMLLYPLLLPLLPLDSHAYGLWAGASIHEVAQVVAAAFQGGNDAGAFGTTAKLARVAMLAPFILILGWRMRHQGTQGSVLQKVPIPWFVLGFIGLVALNSYVEFDASVRSSIGSITAFLMTVALTAVGLETDFSKLKAHGPRPFLLGLASWLFISVGTLALVLVAF